MTRFGIVDRDSYVFSEIFESSSNAPTLISSGKPRNFSGEFFRAYHARADHSKRCPHRQKGIAAMVTKRLTLAENSDARAWRTLASTHPLGIAVLAGVLATHIATITGYWYHGIGLPDLDWPRFNGYLLVRAGVLSAGGKVPADVFAAPDTTRLLLGWGAHTVTGVVFAGVFAMAIRPLLPWRNSVLGNLGKAMVWGLVLATISALWWTPELFPEFNAGFFSSNLGWKTVFGIYLWHMIWAAHLGLIYNPLPADEVDLSTSSASVDVKTNQPAHARA